MKAVKLQIEVNVPNNYQLNDSDDILSLLYDFHTTLYLLMEKLYKVVSDQPFFYRKIDR